MSMSHGRSHSSLKSLGVSVRPMVSMMMPRMVVCKSPLTHSNNAGDQKVTSAVRMTNTLALPLSVSLIILRALYIIVIV